MLQRPYVCGAELLWRRAADVGISVDTAVDVAKDAADFVLLKQDWIFCGRGSMLAA
jgi:hypothetical protein